MSFESAKKYGAISSLMMIILPVISVVALAGLFISFIAFSISISIIPDFSGLFIGLIAIVIVLVAVGLTTLILFLIAMYRLSNYYNEPSIFINVLYALIIGVIGSIVVSLFSFFFTFQSTQFSPINPQLPLSSFANSIFSSLISTAINLVILIFSAVFYKRAFNKLAEKSGVNDFKTFGTLYLIGAVLTIIFVGALLVWIAWIFAYMGFRRLKPIEAQTAANQPISYATSVTGTPLCLSRYCQYCGSENKKDALYCRSCGKQLA
jgi:uncharacterized membrane protein